MRCQFQPIFRKGSKGSNIDREVMMSRYYLHLRDFEGNVTQDEEGFEFPSLATARDHALMDMRELLAEGIKSGEEVQIEAIILADDHGRHVASVPLVAAMPSTVVKALKDPAKVTPTIQMTRCLG
jgi:hypothetical protein